MKRLLVTGGQGLVGQAVARTAMPFNYDLTMMDRRAGDLRDRDIMRRAVAQVKPDVVIHLAARVGGVGANSEDNCGFFSA